MGALDKFPNRVMLLLTAHEQIMLLNSQLTACEQQLLLMVCKAAALFWRCRSAAHSY